MPVSREILGKFLGQVFPGKILGASETQTANSVSSLGSTWSPFSSTLENHVGGKGLALGASKGRVASWIEFTNSDHLKKK